jgi:hyperosmotically inducible protein
MTIKSKFLLIALLAMAPLWGFANQKHNSSSKHQTTDLAAQIESQISTSAPDAVVVVVDRATRTAYVTGGSSNQANVDQVKQALQRMTGIRVMSSATETNGYSGSTSSTYTRSNSRTMDASSMGSTTGMNQGDSDMRTNYNAPTPSTNNPNGMNTDANTAASDMGTAGTAGGSATGTKTGSATNGTAVSDASLTQSVKDALSKEGMIGQNKVVVETRNGLVTLTGTALSEAQADRMVELTREVPGVRDVNVNLQLQDEKRLYTPKPSPQVDKNGRQVDTDEQNPHL